MPKFDPVAVGLSEGFVLTNYTELKGCGCKLPQAQLLELLEAVGVGQLDRPFAATSSPAGYMATARQPNASSSSDRRDVGLDCAIFPLRRYPGMFLIQTTDFFFPLVDDPYMMGRIGCANVLSDLYAMGVSECDNMLMILAVSRKMSKEDSKVCTELMMKGFADACADAGTQCLGGQTVFNPWPIIGGVASSVCSEGDFVRPENAEVGDVLVLTKPLGMQLAVNAHQWVMQNRYPEEVLAVCSLDEQEHAYEMAMESMARLNKVGAELMLKYKAHAATDVTGFGIKAHANNLALTQTKNVLFKIHTLPVLAKMVAVETAIGHKFNLLAGRAAETSGGLLIALPLAAAKSLMAELEAKEGYKSWIVGEVVARPADMAANGATLIEGFKIIEVDSLKVSKEGDEPSSKKAKM